MLSKSPDWKKYGDGEDDDDGQCVTCEGVCMSYGWEEQWGCHNGLQCLVIRQENNSDSPQQRAALTNHVAPIPETPTKVHAPFSKYSNLL